MKKVLLFGGSFDPIHNAHLELAKKAYQMLQIDKGYFILARNPRWKTPNCSASDRLKMLRLALKELPEFKVSLIEYKSKEEENYTYNTIKKMGKFKSRKYYYLIGSDQLEVLDRWYKIDELAKMVQFVVFRRAGYPLNSKNMQDYSCVLLESEEYDISSTKIRYLNSLDCPKAVLDYIYEHKLYYYGILKNYISEKRMEHSFSVANLSYQIAKNNRLDAFKAYQAGLIHDIAKGLSDEDTEKMMKKYFPEEFKLVDKWAYHQFLATIIAKNIFKIEDDEIIKAIKYHATGYSNLSALAMVIYASDKIDPIRGWDSKKLIDLCMQNYKVGFIQVLKDNIIYFKSKNINYHNQLTDECIKEYLGGKE